MRLPGYRLASLLVFATVTQLACQEADLGVGSGADAAAGASGASGMAGAAGGSGPAGADGGAIAGAGGDAGGSVAGSGGGAAAGSAGSAAGGRGGASGGASGAAGAIAGNGGRGGAAGATAGNGGRGGAAGGTAGRGGAGGAPPGVTVWIAGDSTVANGSSPCPIGWGAPFPTLFGPGVTVKNSAVGGRSVRTWLYNVQTVMDSTGECALELDTNGDPVLQARWQAMLNAMTGMKTGDYLFIQFGINDSSATCDRHVGLEAFKISYGMMAQAAKERGAHPIFVTPLSSISCSGSTARGSRGAFVTATQEAGTQYNVPVIDLHALSVALYNQHAFCPIPGGDVSATTTGPVGDFFCDDHTHLSPSGAVEIAGLMAGALRSQSIPLAAYLK